MISVLFCLAAGAGAGSGAEVVPPLVLRRPRFLVLALSGETLAWAAFAARYALLPGA